MGQGKTVQEGLQLKFSYIGEEKEFFRAAFRYDRQNSLREHDFQLIFRFYQDLIQLRPALRHPMISGFSLRCTATDQSP